MSKPPVGGARELPEEGEYKMNVVYVFDIGTQKNKDPKKKDAHQVDIGFELVGAKKENGEPFIVRNRYTYSADERANLSKDLKRGFGVKDAAEFDLVALRGKSCIANIVRNNGYANIEKDSIEKLRGACPKPVTKFKSLFLDDTFDQDVYDSLWDKLKETIAVSPEYDDVMASQRRPAKKKAAAGKVVKKKGR